MGGRLSLAAHLGQPVEVDYPDAEAKRHRAAPIEGERGWRWGPAPRVAPPRWRSAAAGVGSHREHGRASGCPPNEPLGRNARSPRKASGLGWFFSWVSGFFFLFFLPPIKKKKKKKNKRQQNSVAWTSARTIRCLNFHQNFHRKHRVFSPERKLPERGQTHSAQHPALRTPASPARGRGSAFQKP